MAISKTIGGKKYLLTYQRSTKTEANTEANALRKRGWYARVIENPSYNGQNYKWLVFRRSRQSK